MYLALVAFSCGDKVGLEDSKSILAATEKVVYVEERTKGNGVTYGEFGDLVVLDLESGKKYYLTRDTFYDTQPSWSPDGKSIVWLTKRTGDRRLLAIQGVSYPFEIFVIGLNTQKLISPGSNLSRKLGKLDGAYNHVRFTNDGDALLVMALGEFGYTTYRVPLDDSEVSMIPNPPGTTWFGWYVLSACSDTFGFAFDPGDGTKRRPTGLSSLSHPFLKELPVPASAQLGNWSADGTKFLLLGEYILEYDRLNDTVYRSDRPWNSKELQVDKCFYMQTGNFVFFGASIRGYHDGDEGAPITGPREVYVYDRQKHELRQVTNDGLEKEGLASCVIGTRWLE